MLISLPPSLRIALHCATVNEGSAVAPANQNAFIMALVWGLRAHQFDTLRPPASAGRKEGRKHFQALFPVLPTRACRPLSSAHFWAAIVGKILPISSRPRCVSLLHPGFALLCAAAHSLPARSQQAGGCNWWGRLLLRGCSLTLRSSGAVQPPSGSDCVIHRGLWAGRVWAGVRRVCHRLSIHCAR